MKWKGVFICDTNAVFVGTRLRDGSQENEVRIPTNARNIFYSSHLSAPIVLVTNVLSVWSAKQQGS